MRRIWKLYLIVLIAIVSIVIGLDNRNVSANDIYTPKGLDFNNQSPMKEFYTNLDGEWNFFEKVLLTPDEVKNN